MTTAMTPVAERTALAAPVGTDPASRATLVALIQGVANRGEWASKNLIRPLQKIPGISGDDYPGTTSYATLQNVGATIVASFALTVEVGDLVMLIAEGAYVADIDAEYFLRWYDGSAEIAVHYHQTEASKNVPFTVVGFQIVTVAGSKTFSFQGKRGASANTVQGNSTLVVSALHVKLGAA